MVYKVVNYHNGTRTIHREFETYFEAKDCVDWLEHYDLHEGYFQIEEGKEVVTHTTEGVNL